MSLEDFVIRGQAAQAAVDRIIGDTLTDDDQARLTAIMETSDPQQLAGLVYDYYHDADRADRTSRPQLYLHMGMLAGAIMRASAPAPKLRGRRR